MEIKSVEGVVLYKSTSVSNLKELVEKALAEGASLAKASLVAADLTGLKCGKQTNSSFSGANLSRAQFSACDIRGINFSGANLAGANFFAAKLGASNFTGCNLVGANFLKADASGCDFTGANLVGADLTGANTAGAKL